MSFTALFAQLACSDATASHDWFETLFARPCDMRPMSGLAEWHIGDGAGFQLFHNPPAAGHGTMTVFVDDLRAERARLSEARLAVGEIEPGDAVDLLQLRDPDGNLVVLVEKRRDTDG
ncbi:VOC family protein [Jannaschia aquimarina]|uniref:Glyoxalase-like domain protein n=1 Tax=Jannaschia aquimarina TaxID=935700 RepID=A0A0D1D4L7_9RHOB|nr:VOC family protein [Jannaschia aquimarina]KIT15018.1 Glyoxalase-like domain protein [Jannaschia aquimarina]SNS62059.1 hypothetical protein SAMN05421775_101670 [Jannaschia aquimarina]